MVKRYSAAFYRLIRIVGTSRLLSRLLSRLVSRLHPHLYRTTGGRWFVGRNSGTLSARVVDRDARAPVVVLEPAGED